MNEIEKLIELIENLVETDASNFFYEVKLGMSATGKDFTNTIKRARQTNDKRADIRNNIESTLVEILKDSNIETKKVTGSIAESFSFLIDVFVISHLKIWFAEEEIRELNKLDSPDPSRMEFLINASRQANDNRIKLRELLTRKLIGIIKGTEPLGEQDPKFFKAQKRM